MARPDERDRRAAASPLMGWRCRSRARPRPSAAAIRLRAYPDEPPPGQRFAGAGRGERPEKVALTPAGRAVLGHTRGAPEHMLNAH